MKNKILIHKNDNLNKSYQKYFIALLPLIIYGLYKNGILIYLDGSINFISMFKPLLFPVVGLLSGAIVHFVLQKTFKFNSLILYGLIVGMIVPINSNIMLFIVGLFSALFLSCFLEKKVPVNMVCFIKLFIIGLLIIFKNYEYANVVELSNTYAFSFIDILFGRDVGGVCSSSIILSLIGFIYLLTDYYYKKEIPLYAFISYIVFNLMSYIFIKDINLVINNIFASSIVFAFVFIAPISNFSSYTSRGKVVFGLAVGILSGIMILFLNTMEASITAILIVSMFKELIDKLADKRLQKKSFT